MSSAVQATIDKDYFSKFVLNPTRRRDGIWDACAEALDSVTVLRFEGWERLNTLYRYRAYIALTFDDDLSDIGVNAVSHVTERLNALTPMNVALQVEENPSTGEVSVHNAPGMVTAVRYRGMQNDTRLHYVIDLAPRLWLATLRKRTQVFSNTSVLDIIKEKLGDCGYRSDEIRVSWNDTHGRVQSAVKQRRDMVIQYQESDYDFVCRLCEEYGLVYFFRAHHKDARPVVDVVVLGDALTMLTTSKTTSVYKPLSGDHAAVTRLERLDRPRIQDMNSAAGVLLDGYDPQHPTLDLQHHDVVQGINDSRRVIGATTPPAAHASPEGLYEFNLEGRSQAAIKETARLRCHERIATEEVFLGTCRSPAVGVGALSLSGYHDGVSFDVVECRYRIEHASMPKRQGYRADFRALRYGRPYAPPRNTPRPAISGLLSAVIASKDGVEYGALDKVGRYRICFHCDSKMAEQRREATARIHERPLAERSVPVRMIQASAGSIRKIHMPLKVGTEVAVAFLDGDPDFPVIVGALPNELTASPVTSKNAQQSVIQVDHTTLTFDDESPYYTTDVRHKESGEQRHHRLAFGKTARVQGIAATTTQNYTVAAHEHLARWSNSASTHQSTLVSCTSSKQVDYVGPQAGFDLTSTRPPQEQWHERSGTDTNRVVEGVTEMTDESLTQLLGVSGLSSRRSVGYMPDVNAAKKSYLGRYQDGFVLATEQDALLHGGSHAVVGGDQLLLFAETSAHLEASEHVEIAASESVRVTSGALIDARVGATTVVVTQDNIHAAASQDVAIVAANNVNIITRLGEVTVNGSKIRLG